MSSSRMRKVCVLVFMAASTLGIVVGAAAQQKPSIWQQIKDAAKQGAQQQQQHPGWPQKPVAPQQRPPSIAGPNASGSLSGSFTPPAGTKIDQQILAPLKPGARFYVSPHGVHVASVTTSGSRAVMIYDNAEGPKFDEIFNVVFSPDGSRYAYCGRSGNQFVVMADGKELSRSSDSLTGRSDGSCLLGFTSNSKHVYEIINYNPPNSAWQGARFVFDGHPGPDGGAGPSVFSPDGDHYAYVLEERGAGGVTHTLLIVDGKPAGYQGGAPQWSGDSKHLFTVSRGNVSGKGTVEDLQIDGKPIMRAGSIQAFASPVGMGVVSIAGIVVNYKPIQFLSVGNKKVAGSEVDGTTGQIEQVVFSPDGKHFAARYRLQNTRWVITDGKKGLEYSEVDHLGFTADSSKVVYQAGANGKHFIVEGEEESDGFNALFPPVIAPIGARVGAVLNDMTTHQPYLIMDRKSQRMDHPGTDLAFSPDGAHYAFWKNAGISLQLVLDGVPQTASNLGQNIAKQYVFSPDGKHVGHFGVAPNASDSMNIGLFLDGTYIPIGPAHGRYGDLSFTADSKHVVWTHQTEGQDFRLFVDGKPVVDASMAGAPHQLGAGWWDMTPDGGLLFLSEDDNSLKRISITPSVQTSVATLTGGGGTVSAANH